MTNELKAISERYDERTRDILCCMSLEWVLFQFDIVNAPTIGATDWDSYSKRVKGVR